MIIANSYDTMLSELLVYITEFLNSVSFYAWSGDDYAVLLSPLSMIWS
jgi:hypothetical protein